MSRDPRYDILFEPVQIGPKIMQNRFYQTPHASALASHAPGAEAYFRGTKAEGGWAVVNTGMTEVAPDFDYAGVLEISHMWDEADVRNWSLTTERIHEAGSLAGIELGASGGAVTGFDNRLASRSITGIPDDKIWMGASFGMDRDEIRRLQGDFVTAAERARAAGFDIINIHGAEKWSITSLFLMPSYNQRRDEYGGSLENRARFWLETLELVRDAVGDDCAVAARHCLETFSGPGGISMQEEGVGFIELADHLVDFWDVQVGDGPYDVMPGRFSIENFQGEWISQVRPHTEKAIVAPGRFTSPDTMAAIIKSGQQDIIGAARASISDPFLPSKIDEGRIDEIRECIGCNVCVSRVNVPARIVCTQNPTSGEEYRRGWHPERFVRTKHPERGVLVVGAGPAGLECATVLAQQGVEYVHLVEAAPQVGGHFRWVPQLPGLAQWIRLVDYRKAIASRLRNLAVIPNKRLSAAEVLDYGADRVIVATGSQWDGSGVNGFTRQAIPGADASQPHVLTPEQIMVGEKDLPGKRVLVYDCDGYFVGPSLSERLALEGHSVSLVTPFETPGPYMRYTEESHKMIPRLLELGVGLVTGHLVDAVSPGGAQGHLQVDPKTRGNWDADAVVLVTRRVSDESLYRELTSDPSALEQAGIDDVFRVGDCVAPRPQVADAVFDAHRLAREIDSDDPAIPLPWIRECRALGMSDGDFDAIVGPSAPIRPSSTITA